MKRITQSVCTGRRKDLEDPEAELLLRLTERHGESVNRHAILQCVLGDLKTLSDLKPFLEFERYQTTAPDKLRNPAGHYRCTVQRFYEAEAKRRDGNRHEQMRVLEATIGRRTDALQRPVCTLGRCNGTGEVYDDTGVVSACDCEIGRQLPTQVLELFTQMNAMRDATSAKI